MLVEHPARRPTVFEVLKVAHEMSGTRPLIDYPAPNRNIRASGFQQAPPKPAAADKHNSLDFTDAKASSSAAAAEPPLASTITPQRRGRPNRDSMSASQPPQIGRLPPMPQLPPGVTATASPVAAPVQLTKPKLQVTGDKPAPSTSPVKSMYGAVGAVGGFTGAKPRPQSSYIPSKPVLQRLNVTGGEQPKRNTPSPQTGMDAFGLPSKSSKPAPSPGGFGDAFGAPIKSPVSANTPGGFSDSFGSARTTPVASRQFSDSFGGSFTSSSASRQPPPPTLPAGVSGFGDSFTGGAKPKPPSPTVQKPPSPVVRPPSPKPVPAGELTFEQRFPSIDDLEGEKSDAPPATSPKPSHTKRPSIVKNLTGGNLGVSHTLPETIKPIPRSTQVTGTAFKAEQNLRPPLEADSGEPSPTADYLDLLGDDEEEPPSRANNDFLGDDEGSSQVLLPSLRPQLSNQKTSGSRFGVTPPAVAPKPAAVSAAPIAAPTLTKTEATPTKLEGAAQRATLPPISAVRPSRNFNSEQWSPLEAMRNGNNRNAPPIRPPSPSPPSTANKPTYSSLEIDSSDDEAVPEDAYRTEHREHGSQSPGVSRRRSWFEQPLPSPGLTSSGRSRPQTMYGAPTSPPVSASTADAAEPRHARRGSINDMVSRYESLSTGPASPKKDTSAANGHGHARLPSGVARKPSLVHKPPPTVAAKPQALRNSPSNTADRVSSAPGAGPASRDDASSVPASGMAHLTRPPPATQPKPASLRQAVKHGDMPQVDGYSKSSSGRSFPVVRPAAGLGKPEQKAAGGTGGADQSTRVRSSSSGGYTVPIAAPPARRGSGSSSRSSSPEKQQPVNLLIQRWNKGEVKGKHGAGAGPGQR